MVLIPFMVVMQQLMQVSKQAGAALEQTTALMRNANGLLNDQGKQMFGSAEHAMRSLEQSTATINTLLTNNKDSVNSGMQGLNGLAPAVRELRETLSSLRAISQRLEANPSGYLLGSGNGVLNGSQPVKVFTLFLRHLQLESGHFLVLGFCHGLGSGFQSFAGNLQGLTDPRGRRDTDGNADDAQEFHHVHAAPSEHHHPAFVGAYTERQQQAEDACQSDGITQHRHIGKGFHGDQQLVQTLVNGRQSDG